MRVKKLITVAVWTSAIAICAQQARADAFDVTNWFAQCLVGDLGTSPPRIDDETSTTVQNPFQADYACQHLDATADAEYSYIWNATTGQFNALASLTARSGIQYQSSATSSVGFEAHTPLLLTVIGQYTYSMPAEAGRVGGIGATLRGPDMSTIVQQVFAADVSEGDPIFGTFNVNFSYVVPPLPAGQRYQLLGGFSLLANNDGNPTLSTGEGFINYTLAPVPEPSSLGLLGLGIASLMRHRSRSDPVVQERNAK